MRNENHISINNQFGHWCGSSDKSSTTEDDNKTMSRKSGSTVSDTLKNELPDMTITITVSSKCK